MGAVTYPDARVSEFVTSRMVPLQVQADSPLAADFKVKWTPTIVVLDYYGKEHHRTVGFFPPEEFIPNLLLGIGKIDFDIDQFNDAILNLDQLLAPSTRRVMPRRKRFTCGGSPATRAAITPRRSRKLTRGSRRITRPANGRNGPSRTVCSETSLSGQRW